MAKRKKDNKMMIGIGLLAVFVLGIFLVGGDRIQTMFSGESNNGVQTGFAYSYEGKNVEVKLLASDIYTASAIDPTYYVYDEEPANWGNGRVSIEDGYVSSVSSTSGSATLTETPATYYVRSVVAGYYDEFLVVTVPSGSDVPLSDYNDGGQDIVKVQMVDIETLSVSNLDLGISTNETSDKTYYVFANFNVDDNEGFRLDEIKFREDATYSFATDTDGDGIYDEGVNKIVFVIDGTSTTLFDVAGSIDMFSGDDEAIINIDEGSDSFKEFSENGVLSFKLEVTCDQTLDTTGDADEKCGNSEDFINMILVDSAGNTATFSVVG